MDFAMFLLDFKKQYQVYCLQSFTVYVKWKALNKLNNLNSVSVQCGQFGPSVWTNNDNGNDTRVQLLLRHASQLSYSSW